MRKLVLALALLFAGPALAQAEVAPPPDAPAAPAGMTPEEAAAHTALRALRDRLVAAVNAKNPDAILADLDDEILFTAMNNEVVHGKDEAQAYYAKMLVGSQRIVKDMSLDVEVDDLSILMADGEVALAAGSSVANFDMMVGDSFQVPLRWTATLRNTESGWKVAAIHFSANMFDNPLMSGFRTFAYALAGGLGLLGLLIGWLIGRRRKRA
jgi:ketosteroid isomerase-like protein